MNPFLLKYNGNVLHCENWVEADRRGILSIGASRESYMEIDFLKIDLKIIVGLIQSKEREITREEECKA